MYGDLVISVLSISTVPGIASHRHAYQRCLLLKSKVVHVFVAWSDLGETVRALAQTVNVAGLGVTRAHILIHHKARSGLQSLYRLTIGSKKDSALPSDPIVEEARRLRSGDMKAYHQVTVLLPIPGCCLRVHPTSLLDQMRPT
jgi:hypothetical protein